MPNHPSQDHPSWSSRSSRDDGYSRMNRDPYRDSDDSGRGRDAESSSYSQPGERNFYGRNTATQNYGAYRGARGEPWPRNEDRENYSAAPDYGRNDYGRSAEYFEDDPHPANRYHPAGRQYGASPGRQNQDYDNRSYGAGQGYGGSNTSYPQMQSPSRWRDYREQQQAFRGGEHHQGGWGDSFSQPQYGYGTPRSFDQPGFFRADDFSHQAGYTRSEYPEDSYLHGGYAAHGYSRQNQQVGRTIGTQDWQEREGAQRGAFGLQATHRGRGPQGYTRSDDRIREDICERLSEHHYIDASQIRVEVNQGVVTLEGSVDDRWQKYQTEDLVDATSGVKDIQNRLTVSRASRQSPEWTSQQAEQQTASQTGTNAQPGTQTTPAGLANGRKNDKTEQPERGH